MNKPTRLTTTPFFVALLAAIAVFGLLPRETNQLAADHSTYVYNTPPCAHPIYSPPTTYQPPQAPTQQAAQPQHYNTQPPTSYNQPQAATQPQSPSTQYDPFFAQREYDAYYSQRHPNYYQELASNPTQELEYNPRIPPPYPSSNSYNNTGYDYDPFFAQREYDAHYSKMYPNYYRNLQNNPAWNLRY